MLPNFPCREIVGKPWTSRLYQEFLTIEYRYRITDRQPLCALRPSSEPFAFARFAQPLSLRSPSPQVVQDEVSGRLAAFTTSVEIQ
jgi:hypothetical protein